MKFSTTLATSLLVCLISTLPAIAQERGYWKAASNTAKSITGDLAFSGEKLTINFFSLPIAEIRPLKAAEMSAAFEGAGSTDGVGHLYRLSIPGDRRFLHKNTLCGSDETQWMATYVSGKELRIAFFSNATPPVFTAEALSDNVNLCGTFAYAK